MIDLWESLLKESEANHSTVIKRLICPELPTKFFFGISIKLRHRMLMMQLPYNELKRYEPLPECRGFECELKTFGDEPRHYLTFILRGVDTTDDELFFYLTEDIARYVSQSQDTRELARLLFHRLSKWQNFFQKENKNGLSANEQLGLFGELWFLRQYVLKEGAAVRSLSFWKGPDRREHDFQFSKLAVEVKASKQAHFQNVRISNEKQLDANGFDLLLFCLSLNQHESAGETLPDLIQQIRQLISANPDMRQTFEEMMIETGYTDIHEHLYCTKYIPTNRYFYLVGDHFPKLTVHNLPAGVSNVSYIINLASCQDCLIPESEAQIRIMHALEGQHP